MGSSGQIGDSAPELSVLESWKEIAGHFGVTARTVQLWEAERGLPVHRKLGPRGRVYAYRQEVDAWSEANTPEQREAGRAARNATPGAIAEGAVPGLLTDVEACGIADTSVAQLGRAAAGPEGIRGELKGIPGEAEAVLVPWWGKVAETGFRPLPPAATATLLAVFTLLAVVGATHLRDRSYGSFVSVEAEERFLRGVDREGRQLWRFAWPAPYFHAFAVFFDPLEPVIADLDGDGAKEAYIWHQVEFDQGRPENDATLYALDARGSVLWTFQAAPPLRTARREVPPPYAGRLLRTVRYDNGRRRGLLALANHSMYHPARLMLLSAEGRMLREYVHSGHIHSLLVEDFDADGRDEIYAIAISNGFEANDVMLLDPDSMGGASEEPARFQLRSESDATARRPGPEVARVVLPRTDLSKALEPYPNPGLLRRDGENLTVSVGEGRHALPMGANTYFRFTPRLELLSTGFSDNFEMEWNRLWKQGRLPRPFSPEERKVLDAVQVLKAAAPASAATEGRVQARLDAQRKP